MKFPEFRLPYMAISGALTSHLAKSRMTHLAWDEFGPCVLEERISRKPGRAAWRRWPIRLWGE
jgi:hypothetical protein